MKRIISILIVVSMMVLSVSGVSAAKIKMNTIATGASGSLMIKEDGTLWLWKYNFNQGVGDVTNQSVPVKIMDHAKSVAANIFHALVIREDNSLWAWAANEYGEPGAGTDKSTPTKIMDDVLSVAAGESHSLAVKKDKSLWAWGNNDYGQLGDGTNEDKNTPVKIMDNVLSVAADGDYSLALKKDGTLWAWGDNAYGQLGDGTLEDTATPVNIMKDVSSMTTAFSTTFAIKKDGTLWGWGDNSYGELGIGTAGITDKKNAYKATPSKVMEDVSAVSTYSRTLAIKKDGTLWAWGLSWNYVENTNGAVIDTDSIILNASPKKIMDQVATISCGDRDIIAKKDGTLWTLGKEYGDQLKSDATEVKIFQAKIMDQVKIAGVKSGNSFLNWLKNLFK